MKCSTKSLDSSSSIDVSEIAQNKKGCSSERKDDRMAGMTSPSSYVFLVAPNSVACLPSQLQAGFRVFRVTVTKSKITIRKNVLRRTDPQDVLLEHLEEKRVISLHTNGYGEKYLKFIRGGDVTTSNDNDWSLRMTDSLMGEYFGSSRECEECVERIICDWFNHEYEFKWSAKQGLRLFFPLFRRFESGLNPDGLTLRSALATLETFTGRCLKELRANRDWLSFTASMMKSETHKHQSAGILARNPTLLCFATLNTGESFVELFQDDRSGVEAYATAFNAFEMNCMRVMFEHLPHVGKPPATQLVLALAKINTSKVEASSSWSYSYRDPAAKVFALIPRGLKKGLAETFYSSLQRFFRLHSVSSPDNTNLQEVFERWLWENVSEPALRSTLPVTDVRERCVSLFGIDFTEFHSEIITTQSGTTFCHLSGTPEEVPCAESDVFAQLTLILREQPSLSRVAGWAGHNKCIDQRGRTTIMRGSLYSLDDVMTVLEQGAKVLDDILSSLGRSATSENRGAYLEFGHRARNLKSTWRYFDLGITDPMKVLALRRCRVAEESDIRTYAQLPDEMFYELIQLQSGVDLNLNDLRYLVETNMDDEVI